MTRKVMIATVVYFTAGLLSLQCGSDSQDDEKENEKDRPTDSAADAGEDSETASDVQTTDDTGSLETGDLVVGTINIPADFSTAATQISVMYFSSPEGAGMPDAFGDTILNPEIEAGSPFEFSTTQAGLEGDYYLMVVVYCEGGGAGAFPVAGIDWVGAAGPLTLGPNTGEVDAGEVEIMLSK